MVWLHALRSYALCTACESVSNGNGLPVSDAPQQWKSPICMASQRNREHATTVGQNADGGCIGTVQKTFELGSVQSKKDRMTDIVYEIVEHDGGWGYKLGDVFSETYPSKELVTTAANDVAERQQLPESPRSFSTRRQRELGVRKACQATIGPKSMSATAQRRSSVCGPFVCQSSLPFRRVGLCCVGMLTADAVRYGT